jgi:hypothetical protein
MAIDEIIDEIRANREAHAAKLNYDLRAIYEDLKRSEIERVNMGHPFVEPPAKQGSANKSLHRTTAPLSLRREIGDRP